MEDLVKQLADALGMSLVSTSLLLGAVGGFLLRSLFSRRSQSPDPLRPPYHPSRAATPSSMMASSIAAGTDRSGSLGLTAQQGEEIRNFLRQGKKIEAIKRYREITNLGLAEAKSAVEAME